MTKEMFCAPLAGCFLTTIMKFFSLIRRGGLRVLQEEEDINLVISDYRMPGMDGVTFLKQVRERWPETLRIVLSGYADTATIVSAINDGEIYKFIPKPWNDDDLRVTIAKALEVYFLRKQNENLANELMASNEELKLINEGLENLVEERTSRLVFQNKALTFAHTVLNALPVAVLGLDEEGLIVQSNMRADALFGENDMTIISRLAKDILPDFLIHFINQIVASEILSKKMTVADSHYIVQGAKLETTNGQKGTILTLTRE